jgi:hypothetical protein
MAEVHLILSPETRSAHMELHHQEGQLVFRSKLRVGQGVIHTVRRVDALAILCALASCATEANEGNERGVARAVVHLPGVGDGIAVFELFVHLTLRRVLETRDVADEVVRLCGDGVDELRQIFAQALTGHTEGLLENGAALLLVLREQMQAVEGEEAGVDNGADGRLRGCGARLRFLERGAVWLVPLQVAQTARVVETVVVETVVDVQVVLEPLG